MPTSLRIGPYRFFFYSSDHQEPPHVHVRRERFTAKFWLSPVRIEYSKEFPRREIGLLQQIVEEHRETLLREWNEYFSN
ncbi:MAG TPA: DUF4160 domain-containing protein [Promineifilum sp.]|nr:DUF4160 domain-containing protein [Promineifilum sp.]